MFKFIKDFWNLLTYKTPTDSIFARCKIQKPEPLDTSKLPTSLLAIKKFKIKNCPKDEQDLIDNKALEEHIYKNPKNYDVSYFLALCSQSKDLDLNLVAELYNKINNPIYNHQFYNIVAYQYYIDSKVERINDKYVEFFKTIYRPLSAIEEWAWLLGIFFNFIDEEKCFNELEDTIIKLIEQEEFTTVQYVFESLEKTNCNEYLERLDRYKMIIKLME